MSDWELIDGSLATPRGFRAAAAAAGIKKGPGALDLALIVSDVPDTVAAGLFTTNRAAAAPVLLSRQNLSKSRGRAQAVVVNAGNANACTGRAGAQAAEQTVEAVADLLDVLPERVLIASTGVIGVPLKVDAILEQLPRLKESLSIENAVAVPGAIMTTDTIPKSCVLRAKIGSGTVCLAGIAKGAGMIHPRMATLLAFITTDAAIKPRVLQTMLRDAAEGSFNRISVDGDTSTNDTIVALANGASGVAIHPAGESRGEFVTGLRELCLTLAKMVARDGEGAKKLITIEVEGARTPLDAERVARAIANSPLVKTAIAGSDPNWGRIVCAAGYSGAQFDSNKVDIRVNDFYLCRKGLDAIFNEAAAKRELDRKELTLHIHLHAGPASTRFWTCDLTHEYIDINASYRT
ncbi:MAG: bifunctional glutamate N-acetyltransferase/amino-acid acetyltransferase ArgJ [Terriglobia bacterium]